MRQADCVIYDRLVSPDLLKLAPRRCERIYAGKESHEGGAGQERINRLLVEKARRYRTVVRLKGGDPSLFGRLGEERQALARARVPFEVVPGVSSAWAAAAAAGIPLTDRRLSSSVVFATGHSASGKHSPVRWRALARSADTLVILMGWSALPKILRELRHGGRPASTPVAVLRWVSTPKQEIWISRLGEVERKLRLRPKFGPPVVVMIGEVIGRPLDGKKVLITRPVADSAELTRRLQEKGAWCVHLPTIRVRFRRFSAGASQKLLNRLPEFDWVLFNSHHAVDALAEVARRRPLKTFLRGKICAIGPRTEEALRVHGLRAALVPAESSVAGVRAAFQKISIRGKRILIPRSSLGLGDSLARSLRRLGARVEEIAVYETTERVVPRPRLTAALKGLDAATFTSASTARAFLRSVRRAGLPIRKALNGAAVVAIGPSTAKELRAGGVRQVRLPEGGWNLEGLVEAVEGSVKS